MRYFVAGEDGVELAPKITTIVPVSREAYDVVAWSTLRYETEVTAREAMLMQASEILTDLELTVAEPAEVDGLRLPIVLEDGTELPNDLVLFRYTAFAIPKETADEG